MAMTPQNLTEEPVASARDEAQDDLALPLDGFVRLRRTARLSRRRSRIVWAVKWLMLLMALTGTGTLLYWPYRHKVEPSYSRMAAQAAPEGRMEFPRFTGTDTHNRPYELVALASEQPIMSAGEKAEQPVILIRPQAEMTLKNGSDVAFTSTDGAYDQKGQRLKLVGNVVFGYAGRGQAYMPSIDIDLSKNYAWTQTPVEIKGNFGDIQGQGMEIFNGGAVVVVTGRAHAHLRGGSASPASFASAATPVSSPPAPAHRAAPAQE